MTWLSKSDSLALRYRSGIRLAIFLSMEHAHGSALPSLRIHPVSPHTAQSVFESGDGQIGVLSRLRWYCSTAPVSCSIFPSVRWTWNFIEPVLTERQSVTN